METQVERLRQTDVLPSSSGVVETLVEQRVGPGILLLSPTLQLIHINRRAWELNDKITQAEHGKTAKGVLPQAVTELCAEVTTVLQRRTVAKDWEQVQFRHMVDTLKPPVLLQAFGLPDHGSIQQARILILMEEVAPRKERAPEQARERFQLTAREHEVVRYLARGQTNKEIANVLRITEQTAKEHIKHIMEKMHCTTRTGVLAQVFSS